MEVRPEELAQALIIDCRPLEHAPLIRTLARFGTPGLAFAQALGTRIVTLARKQRYSQASPALRRLGVDMDSWPAPPAGLFVVEERSVYLRSRSRMTVAHEFGHALDCALGAVSTGPASTPRYARCSAKPPNSSLRTRQHRRMNISPSVYVLTSKPMIPVLCGPVPRAAGYA
ncbi:MAG: hypothetical protein M3Y18_05780 [Candidatus Eremiobacteraeota bacterium]|nr:hypothetical protein [Candidatus Eremiobacteraeota bacterium]